jgi:glucosamine 6-phosphate synthetase-like amidotransferase/phosphosugar isomerase protein
MAFSTQRRGMHAHGLSWIDRGGRLRRYKAPGPIGRNLACLAHVAKSRMLIGHCRYSTSGPAENNNNNHPHPADGGWIVHNGTIHNADRLAFEWELPVTIDCDSEVFGLLIEEQTGTLLDRVAKSTELLEGPAVMLGLWSRPARVAIVRRGNPLHIDVDDRGNVYFASLPDCLTDPDRILDNTARVVTVRDGVAHQLIQEIDPCRKRAAEKSPPLGRSLRHYSPRALPLAAISSE